MTAEHYKEMQWYMSYYTFIVRASNPSYFQKVDSVRYSIKAIMKHKYGVTL